MTRATCAAPVTSPYARAGNGAPCGAPCNWRRRIPNLQSETPLNFHVLRLLPLPSEEFVITKVDGQRPLCGMLSGGLVPAPAPAPVRSRVRVRSRHRFRLGAVAERGGMTTFGEPSVAQASVILSTGRGETMSTSHLHPHRHPSRTRARRAYSTSVTPCPPPRPADHER